MGTDKTKNEAGANVGGDRASVPVLGSARGLVEMQPGWDEPMSPDEVEVVFLPVRRQGGQPKSSVTRQPQASIACSTILGRSD